MDKVMPTKVHGKIATPRPPQEKSDLGKLQGYVVAPQIRDSIWSLMDFFAVDKDSDIRLVYNGMSCGLSEALWAPNFWLPLPSTAARTLRFGYYMVDIDLGGCS
jgi:hypothetical protein